MHSVPLYDSSAPPGRRTRAGRLCRLGLLAAAIGSCWPLVADEPAGLQPLPKFLRSAVVADRYLSTRKIEEVLRFERVEPVCLQLIKRPGVPPAARREALQRLIEIRHSDGPAELLPWLAHWDTQPPSASHDAATAATGVLEELGGLLAEQPRAALQPHRQQLVQLATRGQQPAARQAALAALIQTDASPDAAWQLAGESDSGRLDFVRSLRWLPADSPRSAIHSMLIPLLAASTPTELRQSAVLAIGGLAVEPRTTFTALAELAAAGVFPEECAASIRGIPLEHWNDAQRQPLLAGLVRHFLALPAARRTTPAVKQMVELIELLATQLPAGERTRVLTELASAAVLELEIRTLEEKMLYDQTVLVVRAGQSVQLTFINDDIMPHNLVIVDSPAAREEVGIAADRMQNEPGALARGYIPDSPRILHATRLVYPKQTDVITFTAPSEPGTYAYVCTFPGHWSKMYGALVVTTDPAAFLAANTPLPSADALLGIRTVDWNLAQLTAELPRLSAGRSFVNGQQNFLKASCFSCHQIQQQGGRIGPDLTLIRDKYKSAEELLRQIMLPSEKVEEKYASVVLEMTDGQVIRGVLVNETQQEVSISENPLVACAPRVVARQEIESLTRSQLSPMPEKLLNTLLDADDVLDLLAYILAGGDPKQPYFE